MKWHNFKRQKPPEQGYYLCGNVSMSGEKEFLGILEYVDYRDCFMRLCGSKLNGFNNFHKEEVQEVTEWAYIHQLEDTLPDIREA